MEKTVTTLFQERGSIDTKYLFIGMNLSNGKTVSDQDGIVFKASDHALVPTLMFYIQECERLGASQEQLLSIVVLINRVKEWREKNPHLCKVAD